MTERTEMAKKLQIAGPWQETIQQSREIGRLLGFDIPNSIILLSGWIFLLGGIFLAMLSEIFSLKLIGLAIFLIGILFFSEGGKAWEIPILAFLGKHYYYTRKLLLILIILCLIASLVFFLISQ